MKPQEMFFNACFQCLHPKPGIFELPVICVGVAFGIFPLAWSMRPFHYHWSMFSLCMSAWCVSVLNVSTPWKLHWFLQYPPHQIPKLTQQPDQRVPFSHPNNSLELQFCSHSVWFLALCLPGTRSNVQVHLCSLLIGTIHEMTWMGFLYSHNGVSSLAMSVIHPTFFWVHFSSLQRQ